MVKVMPLKSCGGKLQTCSLVSYPHRFLGTKEVFRDDLTRDKYRPAISILSPDTSHLPLLLEGGLPPLHELSLHQGLQRVGPGHRRCIKTQRPWAFPVDGFGVLLTAGSHLAMPTLQEEGEWAPSPHHLSPGLFHKHPLSPSTSVTTLQPVGFLSS